MKSNLDLLMIAQTEYAEATNWYLSQSVTAAERFVLKVETAFESIQQSPNQHPRWNDRYRFYLLNKFSYYIPYRLDGDSIVVVAVFHTSRDPIAWTTR